MRIPRDDASSLFVSDERGYLRFSANTWVLFFAPEKPRPSGRGFWFFWGCYPIRTAVPLHCNGVQVAYTDRRSTSSLVRRRECICSPKVNTWVALLWFFWGFAPLNSYISYGGVLLARCTPPKRVLFLSGGSEAKPMASLSPTPKRQIHTQKSPRQMSETLLFYLSFILPYQSFLPKRFLKKFTIALQSLPKKPICTPEQPESSSL